MKINIEKTKNLVDKLKKENLYIQTDIVQFQKYHNDIKNMWEDKLNTRVTEMLTIMAKQTNEFSFKLNVVLKQVLSLVDDLEKKYLKNVF